MRACVCVIHWHCTAQLSMFNMEKHYRNKIIIIIIIKGKDLHTLFTKNSKTETPH